GRYGALQGQLSRPLLGERRNGALVSRYIDHQRGDELARADGRAKTRSRQDPCVRGQQNRQARPGQSRQAEHISRRGNFEAQDIRHTGMKVEVRPLTRSDFVAYGDVIETAGAAHYAVNEGTAERYHDLARVDVGGSGGRV